MTQKISCRRERRCFSSSLAAAAALCIILCLLPATAEAACTSGKYTTAGGRCGSVTGTQKLCCANKLCCSSAGYCGSTAAYCGTGCQAGFGACTAVTTSPSPSPSPKLSPSPSPSPKPVSPSPSPSPRPVSPSPSPTPTPSPSPSPSPPPSGSCSAGYAAGGGACGASAGGLCCPNGQCCSQYGYCGLTTAHCGAGCQALYGACTGGGISPAPSSPSPSPTPSSPAPSPSPPPANYTATPVSQLITPTTFEQIFLHRNDPACASKGFYTYQSFIDAAAAFPAFAASSPDPLVNKREIAAFLGQISHETTGGWPTAPDGPYSWGLCWVTEGGTIDASQLAPYCAATPEYPCAAGKKYFGRGPIQLSWNYNYIPAGQALGFDGLNDPDAVARDATLSFKTAIYFWMTPRDTKPSCHAVITGNWSPSAADLAANRLVGYGTVTNIINGGLECNTGTVQANQADRIGYYQRYASLLGTTVGDNLDCAKSQSFA